MLQRFDKDYFRNGLVAGLIKDTGGTLQLKEVVPGDYDPNEGEAPLIETIYELPLNEKFCFVEYSTQFIENPQASQNLMIFMPYLTGPFGLLNMTLELADGTIVTPNQMWLEQSKSPLINEPIPFTIHNGKPIFDSDVFVVFKRNSKI